MSCTRSYHDHDLFLFLESFNYKQGTWAAILFKKGFNPKILHTEQDTGGRFIIMQIQLDAEVLTLLNVYVPTQNDSSDQIRLIAQLQERLANIEIQMLFMGGDFNVQLHAPARHTNASGTPTKQSYAHLLHDLLEDYHLADVWHSKNPQSTGGLSTGENILPHLTTYSFQNSSYPQLAS